MAVLNVKNLPDALYRKLQARAKREHRSIAMYDSGRIHSICFQTVR